MIDMQQYTIVTVNLDPTVGKEIKKTRPCIVISPIEMNENLQTVIIASITGQPRKYPTRVKMNQKGVKGMIALDQLRTIDKRRIVNKLGIGTTKLGEAIKAVLQEMLID